jgi:hypothetical protein
MFIGSGFGLNRVSAAGDAYGILNGRFRPALVMDFGDEYYRANGASQTFADAITHTRASTATMVDSDGALKWGPHNLLRYSESFENWNASGTSVTENQIIAPNGSTTADEITASSGTSFKNVNVSATPTEVNTYSLYAKSGSHRYIQLLLGGSSPASAAFANFDLVDGVVGSVGGGTSSITSIGNGWYLCSFSGNLTNGNGAFLSFIDTPTAARAASSTSTANFYAWGAHLYRSDLGGMVDNPDQSAGFETYVPTTSAARYLPRRGHHVWNGSAWVNEGLLHESEARTNLLTYSEVVDGAGWTDNGSTSTNLTDGALGVWDGVSIASGGQTFQRLNTDNFVSVTSGDTLTIRAWVKEGTSGRLRINFRNVSLGLSSNIRGVFGSLVPSSNTIGDFSSVKKEDWGNGIVAVSGTITVNFTGDLEVGIGPDSAVAGETVIAYAAQLEVAPTPSSYIPTSGSTVTRAADALTIPAANLPWPEPVVIGPELVTNGTFDTDSDWTKGTGWTISGNAASKVTGVSSGLNQAISLTAGNVYSISYDLNRVAGSVRADFIGGTASQSVLRNSSGSYTEILVANTGNDTLSMVATSTFEGSVDNISVREINPLAVSHPDGWAGDVC